LWRNVCTGKVNILQQVSRNGLLGDLFQFCFGQRELTLDLAAIETKFKFDIIPASDAEIMRDIPILILAIDRDIA
jgi:hypothetical protein